LQRLVNAFEAFQAFQAAIVDPRVKYSVWRFIVVDDNNRENRGCLLRARSILNGGRGCHVTLSAVTQTRCAGPT